MVTSRVHRSSRCSVAGSPCTPMFATCPPGRISCVASSKVAGTPTASMATSAPSPSVSARTAANAIFAAVVDGDVGAERLRRLEADVGLVDRDDVARAVEPRSHDRGETDGPAADDRDDVARLDVAVEHADLVAGRQDVGEHQQLLRRTRRRARDRSTCRRTARARTRPGCRRSCCRGSIRRHRGTVRSDPRGRTGTRRTRVTHDTRTRSPAPDGLDARADRLDGADRFVAEDASVGDGGEIAFEDVEIGAADRGGIDAHDRVGVIANGGLVDFFPGLACRDRGTRVPS